MFFINRLSRIRNVSMLASLLACSFMVQAQVSESAPETASEQKVSEGKQAVYHFPKWPNRKHVKRKMVPPPPPGPYMSTALSGKSLKAPSFSSRANKPNMAFDSSKVSMNTFSPDVDWPTNLRPPTRWVPENGYQYVQPQATNNRRHAAPQKNQYRYRRQQGPQMNWSGMSFNPNSNPNQNNNSTNGTSVSMPGMMGYPASRNQYRRPYPGNDNASMLNRGPVRQNAQQAGLQ